MIATEDDDLETLLTFAKAWAALGWSVQRQLDELLEGEGGMNPNAVRAMRGLHPEIDRLVDAFLTREDSDEEED